MSLQFIIGKSGSGKSHYLTERVVRESIEHPENNYIVLVPEQATMQAKKQFIHFHPKKTLLNIDILNFPRFAHRILEEAGGERAPVLDDVGKSLILRKLAQEKKEYLKLLGGHIRKNGYIQEIKSVLSELAQYRVSPEALLQQAGQAAGRPLLQYKLEDLALLYRTFQEYLKGRYIVSEELLEVLCRVIGQSETVKKSIFILDGYTGFTPVQFQLMEALFRYGKKVLLTVTLGPEEYPVKGIREQELFALSKKTIEKLLKLAETTKTKVLEPVILNESPPPRFQKSPALAFLEEHLFRYQKASYEEETEEISLHSLASPYEEIVFIERLMQQLIRSQGYRYRDFAIVSGDIDRYAPFLEQVFEASKIPYFKDNKRCILENPMMECVCSALEMVLEDFSYESVFRYLRSGLSDLSTESIDVLENYVIATGIHGLRRWKKPFSRVLKGMDEQELMELNESRAAFLEEIEELTKGLKGKGTVEEKTRCLYLYLKQRDIQQKLAEYEDMFRERQELGLAREYGQIYKLLMDVLDTYVNLLGDEIVTLREYRDILQSGFEQTMVGNIPAHADQVMVGDIERSRLSEVRVLFLVGANDGVIPKAEDQASLLSELERDLLREQKLELAPGSREKFYTQKFYLYLNLTKPRERLYLTYAAVDTEGKAQRPSYLISSLMRLFPKLRVKQENPWEISYIHGEKQALEYLLRGLDEKEKKTEWKELFTWFLEKGRREPSIESLLALRFMPEKESAIGRKAAEALYGDYLEGSVTRLEQYASCAYAYFLEYGLRLKEREEFFFAPVDMGSIFHKTLEYFARYLKERDLSWAELEKDRADEILEECFQKTLEEFGQKDLFESSRARYMEERMRRILRRTLWSIRKQLERGKFVPSQFEVSFEKRRKLPEHGEMLLKGSIDRLDLYEEEDRLYMKVLDYKSGKVTFDLTKVYLGLELQLPLYLAIAEERLQKQYPGKEVVPAGILYSGIEDPMVAVSGTEEPEEVEQMLFEQFRLLGMVQQEEEVIRLFDENMIGEDGKPSAGNSDIIPVGYKKDGGLTAASKAYSRETLEVVSSYVNHKSGEFGQEILNGNIEAKPYELSNSTTSCTYCSYQKICPFDGKRNLFRRVEKEKDEDVIHKMKEKVYGHEVDNGAGTGDQA